MRTNIAAEAAKMNKKTKTLIILLLVVLVCGIPIYINQANKAEKERIMTAAKNGDFKTVTEILKKHPAIINEKDKDGNKYGNILLSYTVYYGAKDGSKDAAELLINLTNININTQNKYGFTLLDEAVEGGSKNMVVFLINKGADVNAKNSIDWETPLHVLADRSEDHYKHGVTPAEAIGIAEVLIASGVDVNAKDKYGATPLHCAAIAWPYIRKEVAEFLINKGADINVKDNAGMTPLYLSVEFRRKEVATLLISKGADVNARDNNGKTPLDYAKEKGYTEMVEILQKSGAK